MPLLHESVAYCEGKCDQIVAVMELTTCAADGCTKQVCPDCAIPTGDPDSSCCSNLCAARFGWIIVETSTSDPEAA